MRHQHPGGLRAALLVTALVTSTTAALAQQPAPSRTAPGRSAPVVSDVGPAPAEDRDSHGAIVFGEAPPKPSDAALATQSMGAAPAKVTVPARARDNEMLRKRGAGGLIEN